jgi:hypothetical protein
MPVKIQNVCVYPSCVSLVLLKLARMVSGTKEKRGMKKEKSKIPPTMKSEGC